MLKTKSILALPAFYCLMHLVIADFPIDPQPCRFKDTKCFIERFNYFLSEKYSGDKSINLMEFDPLRVSLVRIKKDPNSPINIDLRLKNNIITGLKDAKLVKVTGFEPDMTLSHELVFKVKQFHMKGNYSVKGRVVILPVTGSGDHDLIANDVTFKTRFNGTPQQRNGATYMTIENMSGTINAKRVTYKFNNLFNGDRALSDNINTFINDNWRDIWDEIRGNLIEGLQPTIQKVFNDVFATMPYTEFFAKE